MEALAQKFKEGKLETNAYTYLSSPDYPVVKDKPKRLLILAAGMLIGLILSIIYILLVNECLNNRKYNSKWVKKF